MSIKWHPRKGTQDLHIITEVYHRNCYGLPDDMTGITVIDVGAHIGSFTVACLERNCKMVHAFEPDPGNFQLATQHIAQIGDPSCLLNLQAVTGSGLSERIVYMSEGYHEWKGYKMTGGKGITHQKQKDTDLVIRAIDMASVLSSILDEDTNTNVWVKLDCEGSEHHILSSGDYKNVARIVGECHRFGGQYIENLIPKLQSHGFLNIDLRLYPDSSDLCLFFANKAAIS